MTSAVLQFSDDLEKHLATARMRRVATAILAVLGAIFVITHFLDHLGWPVLLIQSMAEAGMIGGLADWFAVEALFRRPLGLPIPHTALLPANQARAAENVGKFFETYFLEPGDIRARVIEMKPARLASTWLVRQKNAQLVATHLTMVLQLLVQDESRIRLGDKLRHQLRKMFSKATPSDKLAEEIAQLLRISEHEDLTDRILEIVRTHLKGNRDEFLTLVQENSRWWIASGVDRRVAQRLVDAILAVIDDLMNEQSPMRADFISAVERIITELSDNGTLADVVTRGKATFLESGAFDDLAETLIHQARDRISAQVRHDPEAFAADLAKPIRAFARQIARDPGKSKEIDQLLGNGAAQLMIELKQALGSYISGMISSWEPELLVGRFESEVGRDLQFIRINGSVLGAAIGGLIFAASALFP